MTDQPIKPRLEAQTRYARPHVLVVTDDAELATFLSEGLPLGGFWVSVIASGLQALEVFRLRQFDLVLLDAEMRNFNAAEFLRRLRGLSTLDSSGTSRTVAPVVVISSGALSDTTYADVRMGIIARLRAPLELDELVRELHAGFERWQEDHPSVPLADSAVSRAF